MKTLLCLLLFALCPLALAEGKPKAVALDLTRAEIETAAPLVAELERLTNEQNAALNDVLSATTKDGVLAGAYRFRELVKDQQRARERYGAWLVTAQKAHECEGCTLDLSDPQKPKLSRPKAVVGLVIGLASGV